jgi:hypothetical protein
MAQFNRRQGKAQVASEVPFVGELVDGLVPRKFPKELEGTNGFTVKVKVVEPFGRTDIKVGDEVEVVVRPDVEAKNGWSSLDKTGSEKLLFSGLTKTETGFASTYPAGSGENNTRDFVKGVARPIRVSYTDEAGARYKVDMASKGVYSFAAKSELGVEESLAVLKAMKEHVINMDQVSEGKGKKGKVSIKGGYMLYHPERAVLAADDFSPDQLFSDKIQKAAGGFTNCLVRIYDAGSESHNASNCVSVSYSRGPNGEAVGGLSEDEENKIDSFSDVKAEIVPCQYVTIWGSKNKEYVAGSALVQAISRASDIVAGVNNKFPAAALTDGVFSISTTEFTSEDGAQGSYVSSSKITPADRTVPNPYQGMKSVMAMVTANIDPKYVASKGETAPESRAEDHHATTATDQTPSAAEVGVGDEEDMSIPAL